MQPLFFLLPMTFSDLETALRTQFPDAITESQADVKQPYIVVQADALLAVCTWLRNTPAAYFDFFASLSAVDYGNRKFGAVYHLRSIPHGHELVLKAFSSSDSPILPSVCHLWRAADWHEREAFDLLGIVFEGHPDLRRLLLPEDWDGHPLRKDYQQQETYRGVKVAY